MINSLIVINFALVFILILAAAIVASGCLEADKMAYDTRMIIAAMFCSTAVLVMSLNIRAVLNDRN